MGEMDDRLWDAWLKVKAKVLADSGELKRRLARREMALLQRPPRAWCLAVRAADRRITEVSTYIEPEEALYPARNGGFYGEHEVRLDTYLLKRLCVAVKLEGDTPAEAGAKLGVIKGALAPSRVTGKLRQKYVRGLGAYWGHPVPLLYGEELDPAVRGFAAMDRVWDWTRTVWSWWLPEEFEQTIKRVPRIEDRTARYDDTDHLHPEHPKADRGVWAKRKRYLLPPAPPDEVWYKWKGEEYIGYDWRAAERKPRIKADYERHERAKAKRRERMRRQRRENPAPSQGRGSAHFWGWRWICPKCGKRAAVMFFPLPVRNMLEGALRVAGIKEKEWIAPWKHEFACARCHQLREFQAFRPQSWNEVVAYLSGGLLYGSEVPRPEWFKRVRQREYAPRPSRTPSKRREEVTGRLIKGWSYKQIAADLGIHWHTVDCHARRIYKLQGVHSRAELARKLGVDYSKLESKRSQVVEDVCAKS